MEARPPAPLAAGRALTAYMAVCVLAAGALTARLIDDSAAIKVTLLAAIAAVTVQRRAVKDALDGMSKPGALMLGAYFVTLLVIQVYHVGELRQNVYPISLVLALPVLWSLGSWRALHDVFYRFAGVVAALMVLAVALLPPELIFRGGRLYFPSHPNQNSALVVFLLPFVLFSRRAWTGARVAVAAGLVGVLLLTKSRTGLATFGVFLAFAAYKPWRQRGAVNGGVALALALLAVLLAPFAEALNAEFVTRGSRAGAFESVSVRMLIWRVLVERIAAHPLVGLGLAGTHVSLWENVRHGAAEATYSAHNLYLEVAASQGVPLAVLTALLVLATVVVSGRRMCSRRLAADEDLWLTAFLVGVAGLMFSLSEANLLSPGTPFGVVYWSSVLMACARWEPLR